MARKLGSPSLSRLGVSRYLEIENNATITGLGLGLVAEMNLVELGLVAEMNLVELGLVADICCRCTRIGMMAADSGGVYGLGLAVNMWWWYMAAAMKLVRWWYMVAAMMMMRW